LIQVPNKTNYLLGEALKMMGVRFLYAHESGNWTEVDIADCTVSGYDAELLGEQTISVAYNAETIYFKVKVLNPIALFICDVTDNQATITNFDSSFKGELTIPSTFKGYPVTGIGSSAFAWSSGLTSITIPDSVTAMGSSAFYNCHALKTVIIANGVTDIGDRTFYNCNSLKSITIPDGVTSIGARVFNGCNALTSITIPDSVTSIGEWAFYECYNLTIYGAPGSAAQLYADENGIPFIPNREGFYLLQTPTKKLCLQGNDLDFSGMRLLFVDAQGLGEEIEVADCMVTGFNPNLLGNQTVSITYRRQTVTFSVRVLQVLYPESDHPYLGNTDRTWHYTHPQPADSLEITFSSDTQTQSNCDYIFIYDGNGALFAKYSGVALAGQTVTIPGNYFSIRLTSDRYETYYGFEIDNIAGIGGAAIASTSGSGCVVDTDNGIIYGLTPGLTKAELETEYIQLQAGYTLDYSTNAIGTGTVVSVVKDAEKSTRAAVTASFTVVIFGDLNGDGNVDSTDAGMAIDYENYMVTWNAQNAPAYLKAGDLNGDGRVDSIDAGIAIDVANYLLTINQATGRATII
ncbi:MAG TPA: leucine-rich repeat protein, partial [Clostridia bacterium]|nr:leucine-rich repeat protein [Clostridia bacterium]